MRACINPTLLKPNLVPQLLPQPNPKVHAVSVFVPSAFYTQHPKQELAFLLGSF